MSGLIDPEELNKRVFAVQDALAGLDMGEKDFVIQSVLVIIAKEKQKHIASDMIGALNFGSFFKKARKDMEEEDI